MEHLLTSPQSQAVESLDFPGNIYQGLGALKTSARCTKIYKAMLAAQKKIQFAKKDSDNPHFKSKYADLGSLFNACKAHLNDEGILIVQAPRSDAQSVTVTTVLMLEEEWISCELTAPLERHTAQSVGSAITYLRRYSLGCLAGVVSDDDDGNAATEAAPKATVASPKGSAGDGPKAALKAQVASSVVSVSSSAEAKRQEIINNSDAYTVNFGDKRGALLKDLTDIELAGAYNWITSQVPAPKFAEQQKLAVAVYQHQMSKRGLITTGEAK